MAQRLAFDVFADDEARAVGVNDLEDGNDVRVIELGDGRCLLLEAPHAVGVRRTLGGQHFERHGARQVFVPRPVDFAHAAPADQRFDAVVIDVRAEKRDGRRLGEVGKGRRFHETSGPFFFAEQGLDLAAQSVVAAAGAFQKGLSPARFQVERLL